MSYARLLSDYIKQSGKTLEQISQECAQRQITVHPTYISKLRLGKRPAPSPEITRTLAEVVGGDAALLIAEANLEKLDADHKEMYENQVKKRMLIDFTLEKLSRDNRLYSFISDELAALLEQQAGRLAFAPPIEALEDRQLMQRYLADSRHDEAAVEQLLEALGELAGAPKVLFERLKASTSRTGKELLQALTPAEPALETYPVGQPVKIPIIGTVTAGPNGTAYEDYEGDEWTDAQDVRGGGFFYLRVKGDSMTGDGILPNDLALVRETPEVEYGDIAVVLVDGEEGTIKRVYKLDDGIMLQSSNPAYPPRIFRGSELEKVRIVGKVKQTIRRY
ncbi:LexA family protein [Paenibacillus sp. 1P07SE]|uniref:LexA family protein n=1 Tax=Paenibacillus sp. 1P07SE TaxID=3132209 RepID=UPI0039A74056